MQYKLFTDEIYDDGSYIVYKFHSLRDALVKANYFLNDGKKIIIRKDDKIIAVMGV